LKNWLKLKIPSLNMKDIHGNEIKEQPELIVPKTIAGMLTNKRYTKLRKMGIKAEEIAALCLLHERGQYPGERLFSATKKKEILSKKYKKLRKSAEKEIVAKYREMRAEMRESLKKAKAQLESEGVDFEKLNAEAKEQQMKIKEALKEEIKKSGRG
jgi:hypothetical protein